MASFSSSSLLDHQHGQRHGQLASSKAQAALAKIIAIITTVPPPPPIPTPAANPGSRNASGSPEAAMTKELGSLGLCVDLCLRLGPPPEIGGGAAEEVECDAPIGLHGLVLVDEYSELDYSGCVSSTEKSHLGIPAAAAPVEQQHSISPAVSFVGIGALMVARSSEGECDPEEVAGGGESHKRTVTEAEDVNEVIVEKEKKAISEEEGSGGRAEAGTIGGKRSHGSEGYLNLLLEAVRQVSGDFFDNDEHEQGEEKLKPSLAAAAETVGRRTRRRSSTATRRKDDVVDSRIPFDLYEETAPIVRSRRGRNQALPSRYRDSILEPWRKPPTVTRHGRTARP